MKRISACAIYLLMALVISGCNAGRILKPHRVTIQQGNVISQKMVDRLKPGMTKSQVRFVLGNPVVDDGLDAERWDYIYTIGISGGAIHEIRMIVHFENDRLARLEGDYKPSAADAKSVGSQAAL